MLPIIHKKFAVVVTLSLAVILTACGGGGGGDSGGGVGGNGEADITAPEVINTSRTTNVDINSAITATFSEALNPDTITKTSFTLTQQGINNTAVMGTVSYSDTTATFVPVINLDYDSTYEATLTTAIQDPANNGLANNFTWTFTTAPAPDTTAPTVLSTNPAGGAVNVSVGAGVIVTFSEAMNATTLTSRDVPANIQLHNAVNRSVAGSVSYLGTTATFTPYVNLANSTTYTLIVVGGNSGVKDLAGNALAANYAVSFITSPAPDTTAPIVTSTNPTAGAIHAEPDAAITVTFSEAMNATTLLAMNSFTLTGPNGNVAGSVSYSGLTATFTPTNPLDINTSYSATLTTAVQDLALNGLASNHVWNFVTRPWTRQLGNSSLCISCGTQAKAVATDKSGNVYVTGYTAGDLDGNTRVGVRDMFVVKYDSNSAKQWTRQLLTASSITEGTAIATDASGNVYVTGYSSDSLVNNTSVGNGDYFNVVKYNSNGSLQWVHQYGSAYRDRGQGIAIDASGYVYVTGVTASVGKGTELFVAKYDSNGLTQWTQQLGTATNDIAYGVVTDASGNVYVTGTTTGDLDGNVYAGGVSDLFVVKYDSAGLKQWTRQLGTTGRDEARGIAVDANSNVYVTGYTDGGLDGNTSAGLSDLFVVKYDSTGAKQWTQQLGTTTNDFAYGVATDVNNNVYVTGYNAGGLDGNFRAGGADLFVVKYDSAGAKQWSRQLGTIHSDVAYGVATDLNSNVYVTGYTTGDLDGNTNAGGIDLFVVKYDSAGVKQ
jgi:hypothetical protein